MGDKRERNKGTVWVRVNDEIVLKVRDDEIRNLKEAAEKSEAKKAKRFKRIKTGQSQKQFKGNELDSKQANNHDLSQLVPPSSTNDGQQIPRENVALISKPRKANWLCEGLKIRIRSKKLKSGALYGKRGSIQFIDAKGRAQILLESGKELKSIRRKCLETVVGGAGTRVKFVKGRLKGKIGRVYKRLKGKAKALLTVPSQGSAIQEVDLGEICEFV